MGGLARRALRYSIAPAATAAMTGIRLLLEPATGERAQYAPFFVAIVMSGVLAGRGPALLATVLSALSVQYFFIEPRFGLGMLDRAETMALGFFVAAGCFIAWMAGHMHAQREHAELAGEQAKQRAEAINRIAILLHSSVDVQEILHRLMDEGAAILHSDSAAVSLREGGRWRPAAVHGMPAEILGMTMSDEEERHAVLAIETRRPVAVADVASDERFNREHLRRHKISSVLAVPLLTNDQPLGVLFFNYQRAAPRRFAPTEIAFAQQLAAVAASALSNARSFRAVRESERLYRGIGESIDYGIWICDAEGRNTYASESLLKLVGITQEQCAGFQWGEVLHPEDRAATIAAWKECVRSGSFWYREHRYLGVDGRYHPILACGVPVRDERGRIEAWAGINLDISRLKAAEGALLAAKESAEAANRAKDLFLAKLSHELRTPLMPVVAALASVAGDARLPEDLRDELRMMERNISLEVHLINDLLDVSRIVNGKLALSREPVDLAAVLRDVGRIIAPELDARGQSLTIEQAGGDCWVEADRARLHQVFWNLLYNAIKFSPASGRIAVELGIEGEWARVDVRDNGAGIEPDLLSRLFRPFEQERQLSSGRGGLGLGLAISRGIVELHGGTISAQSAGKGQGATFTVRLGLVAPPARQEAPQSDGSIPAGRAEGLRILLVEDHPDTARVICRLLEREGHRVSWANCVAGALEFSRRDGFDLLICDLTLPDGSGHDVMRGLTAEGRPLRGIAVSGHGSPEDIQASIEAGFAEHLVKPISFQAIHAALLRAGADEEKASPGGV